MKRIILAMVFVALLCSGAWAAVAINSTNFPDDNFRSYVSGSFDVNSDDVLSDAEIAGVTSIDVHGRSIASLQGVGYFTALTELFCYSNQLTELDLSNNTSLRVLSCANNQLTTLDVSNNTALTALYCGGNPLTGLDVSNNTALTELSCITNKLATLDVSNNTALQKLYCMSNRLTELDVSNNTALIELLCVSNPLRELNLSNNTALISLDCSYNNLAVLDLSNNTALTDLDCSSQTRTPLRITSSGNTSYPYQLDLTRYMTSAQTANVSNVQGYDSDDVSVGTSYANGVAQFTASPAKVTYDYATGYSSQKLPRRKLQELCQLDIRHGQQRCSD